MDRDVLRIIDANANRAREALRVVEDYARFVRNDEALCAELKQLRHDFAGAVRSLVADAIFHRDTPGDVGTEVSTESEMTRNSAAEVVVAAGKRLGEALRVIEEYWKTTDSSVAYQVELIRYRWYDIEHRLAFALRPLANRFADVRLYVLITESLCKRPWIEAAEEAIRGGADCLQLREKNLSDGELFDRARRLAELCHLHGVLCIINDRPDVAVLAGADGVHLGQQDMIPTQVRKLVGYEKIIGVSTHSIDDARMAVTCGADYIGVGPVFPSRTKPRDFLPGLELARQVAQQIRIPAVAIAGIDPANVDEVLATGLRAVAVTAAIIGQHDVRAAARQLKCKLLKRSETGCPTT